MNTTVLGKMGNLLITQNNHTRPNRNIIAFGGPGSYKTQSIVITNTLAETENSLVITDPKAEVYENTVTTKIRQGYTPFVINFDDMRHSNRYNPLDYISRDIQATTVANKIVETSNKDAKKDVWFYSQRALLKAVILFVLHESSIKVKNLSSLTNFLQEFNPQKNEDGVSELDRQFINLPPLHPARRAYELGFQKTEGEMQSSIIVSLLTTIADFIDEEVANFTSLSDFDLKDVGRKKIVLYIIIPPMNNAFENLTNLFISQLFEQLYELGAENHAKLPSNVDFILDEFVNLGKFPNYEEFLATCRGYGIGATTICQSLTQLQDKYGRDRAESILGNNAVKICLNAANRTTAKYFSDLLGKATVKIETGSTSVSRSEKDSRSTSDSYNYTSRNLMSEDEIMRMDSNECIIVFSNKAPLKAQKALQYKIFPGNRHVVNHKDYEREIDLDQPQRQEYHTEPVSMQTDEDMLNELSQEDTNAIYTDSDTFFD